MSMLLAVDTSTQWTGLALYDGTSVRGELCWQTRNHHTVELAPAVDRLLKQTGIKPVEIECFGAALGPGSFTSLRIGLALVKGMALSLRVPVVGVPTLDFLAAALPVSEMPLAAVLQAGRGRLALIWYAAKNGRWVAQGEPQVSNAAALFEQIVQPTLVCGELNAEERALLGKKRKIIHLTTPAQCARRPSFLAEMAWERWKAGKTAEIVSLAPIYLHVAEAIPA
jgi:tRNA threonylcarbamoyladenosine biosynthesis protein TsaB